MRLLTPSQAGCPRTRLALALAAISAACVVTADDAERRAAPQRPRFSSNTRTTAAGTLEVEGGVTFDPGDSLAVPVRVKTGLDPASEAYFEWSPLQFVDVGGSDLGGIGDLVLGYRQRFKDETPHDPALAVQLEAKLPTADHERGLGTGETDLFVAGSAEKQLAQARVNGFYQLGLLGEVGDGGLDLQHGLALVATRAVDRRFEVFGEGSFVWTPEQDDEQLFATLGANYASSPSIVFDAAILVGLTSDAPDFVLLFGVTRNFGRILWPRRAAHP